MVATTTIGTRQSLLRLAGVGTLHSVSAKQLQREPVEHFVATDGYLQAAVRDTHLRLEVKQPGSSATTTSRTSSNRRMRPPSLERSATGRR